MFKSERATIESFITTFDGFIKSEGWGKIYAYEMTEFHHKTKFGKRRFKNYYSFTNSRKNYERNGA